MKCPNCGKEIMKVVCKNVIMTQEFIYYYSEIDQITWSSDTLPIKEIDSELNGYYCPECDYKIMKVTPRKLRLMMRGHVKSKSRKICQITTRRDNEYDK
jgi:DNA-directed RNA polymerase subunit RPC12/RpoP